MTLEDIMNDFFETVLFDEPLTWSESSTGDDPDDDSTE
jgi:hypothetical protein